MSGEADRDVMSHAAPTFCIHVPMFDATDAIQSQRKTSWVRGDHAERGLAVLTDNFYS
jgi:hypothetical protein